MSVANSGGTDASTKLTLPTSPPLEVPSDVLLHTTEIVPMNAPILETYADTEDAVVDTSIQNNPNDLKGQNYEDKSKASVIEEVRILCCVILYIYPLSY